MSENTPVHIASKVSKQRLLDQLKQLAFFGALDNGGVDRQALSKIEIQARRWLIDWAYSLGCKVFTDECANLFIRREGQQDLPPVVTGSHIDTQPCGGNLDGCYGVIAGMECLAILNEMKITTCRPIEVVVWTNEEGSRFSPGAMGSSCYVKPELLQSYLTHKDINNITLKQALQQCHQHFSDLPRRSRVPFFSFIELHIEQGPVLETENRPLAVVNGIQGVRWYEVTCLGESAHAGTTPMPIRQDAMTLARFTVDQIEQSVSHLPVDELRLTFGRWDIKPNAINTIASRVTFTLDFRHANPDVLAEFDLIIQQCMGDNIQIKAIFDHEPVAFDTALLSRQCATAKALHIDHLSLMSGAFHDAMHLAEHCPTSMFFVPSHRGISHNPAEYTHPDHLHLGAQALAYCLAELANQD
ncbi:M20 family metallo-hydrolase [Acinetobacter rathckeae]|uniref:M20 family metallo-hydrolase n=1 Tax=Acinetobacter rathckeae TaxID=2605272 RepID=UPI0018A2753D|nr:M20 family metallo-hydrolase [Acinetobacter rathckeae]MBF7686792.1 M20 family metallo-hydrolase [Acinetobacter rathckeae]MBF7695676.1 M20 family metallo-hydrolase [Acinetobacter rathckeae]